MGLLLKEFGKNASDILDFLISELGISSRLDPRLLIIQFFALLSIFILLQEKRVFRLGDFCLKKASNFLNILTTGKYRPILLIVVIETVILFSLYRVQKSYPIIMDEHAHLLIADNALNGSFAGETHPEHEFFETFFVISNPSYTGKYPPGLGFLMAFGKFVFSQYIAGVWLAFVIGSLLVYLFFLNFFNKKWSFIGALFLVFNVKILTMWGLSYWGGALSLFGSALFWVSFVKLNKRIDLKYCLLLPVGFALMFLNRPYESALIAICPAVFLLINFIKKVKSQKINSALFTSLKFFGPIILTLCMTIVLILFYNKQVTGDMLVQPHQLYTKNYEGVKPFIFQDMSEPEYPFAEAKIYNDLDVNNHVSKRKGFEGYIRGVNSKFFYYLFFFFELVCIIPLVFYLLSRKSFHDLVFGITLLILFIGSSLVTYEWGHYIACASPLIIYMLVKGTKLFYESSLNSRFLRSLFISFLGVLFINLLLSAVLHIKANKGSYSEVKNSIADKLEANSKDDLVFVSYGENHLLLEEWVYNSSDIDNSPVIWARDLGIAKNDELINYYNNDRNTWRLEVDGDSVSLTNY